MTLPRQTERALGQSAIGSLFAGLFGWFAERTVKEIRKAVERKRAKRKQAAARKARAEAIAQQEARTAAWKARPVDTREHVTPEEMARARRIRELDESPY